MRQEGAYYDDKANATGALMARLRACDEAPLVVTGVWGELALYTCTAIEGFILSCVFGPILSVILACFIPILLILGSFQIRATAKTLETNARTLEQASRVAGDYINNVRTIKSMVQESFALDHFAAYLQRPLRQACKHAATIGILQTFQSSAITWIVGAGFLIGDWLVNRGTMSFSNVTIVVLNMMSTILSVSKAAGIAVVAIKGKFAAQTTLSMLDRMSTIDPVKPGIVSPSFKSDFELTSIAFKYPNADSDVFNGHFSIEGFEGKSVALVGPSGCGKSTVIALLQRWYNPKSGSIRVGDIPIGSYQLMRGLRKNIGFVLQQPDLFNVSIFENIAYGTDEKVTLDDVIAVSKLANAHAFIQNLPEGYNTLVGNKGSQLSGGQKQRIAIARALIRKPRLLLLDEATSALDSASERIVQEALDRASAGRTTVIVAHRLRTIQNVDTILVVNNGLIVESGTHNIKRGVFILLYADNRTCEIAFVAQSNIAHWIQTIHDRSTY